MKLSKTEEQLMEILWKNEKIFMKDLLEALPEPKLAATTVATMLKRMQEKGFVSYKTFGNSRQYYSIKPKDEYFSKQVNGIIQNFFGNSAFQFASFFTANTELSNSELESLKKIIDGQIKKNQS
jgi:BlaI family penicillinase repressor